jgi:predicted RNA-binding protein with PUA-like domain
LEYTSQRTSAWGSIFSELSNADRLKIDGSASILRYDTPDSLNVDDRDELLLALSVEETHNFSQYLSVGIEANVTLSHLVYLDRLQSANNNWNRVLSLSPRISLRPVRWFVSENIGEVVANYTVYDFEEQVASVKSFSFRQVSWSDSTTIALNHRIDFSFSGTLRAYERGILKWKEFKEKPLDYFVEKSLWPRFLYRTIQDVALSVGYRYFSRDQYSYDGTSRTLTHSIVTAGPTVGVEWHGVGGTSVLLSGWRESSAVDSGQSTLVSNLSVSVSLVF